MHTENGSVVGNIDSLHIDIAHAAAATQQSRLDAVGIVQEGFAVRFDRILCRIDVVDIGDVNLSAQQ